MLLRAVLDANIFISAAIKPTGTPGQILLRFVRNGAFDLVVSQSIADEVERALKYPQVLKCIRGSLDPESWLEDLWVLADFVADRAIDPVCADRDDDKYIAAALEGRATYVVTGDQALLAVGEHHGVHIVTPRRFDNLLNEA